MKSLFAVLCCMSAVTPLFIGCGTELESTNPTLTPTADAALTRTSLPLPAQLSCVSAPSTPVGRFIPEVVRFELARSGSSYQGAATTGRQFQSHAGDTGSPAASVARPYLLSAHLDKTGKLSLESATKTPMSAFLRRDGVAWRGTFAERGSRTMRGLTCWTVSELTPGHNPALPARFDWSKGHCVDASGRAAHNRLPIELVRETMFGECADLSGVSLNGDDFGYPDLQYWQLAVAKLNGASLHFANLRSANLHGADLSSLEFGYARITGTIDDTTILPPSQGGACSVSSSPWAGKSCDCTR